MHRGAAVVTELRGADEVADAAHAAVVLSLGFVELHADPLAAGELRRTAEPQRAGLQERDTERLGLEVRGETSEIP